MVYSFVVYSFEVSSFGSKGEVKALRIVEPVEIQAYPELYPIDSAQEYRSTKADPANRLLVLCTIRPDCLRKDS